MSVDKQISAHYTHGELLQAIENGLEKLGLTPSTVSIDDLAPVDEFHIGGRQASEEFLDQLSFSENSHVLDIGCGIGGASRLVASRYQCKVTGIDLTLEYIETGKVICSWLGLNKLISLYQGSAIDMPFDNNDFNGAFMMHVGMNIENKIKLFKDVFRVLTPNAVFGVYDVMKSNIDELEYPVPWATTVNESKLASPEVYKEALSEAGFSIVSVRNRRDFALAFFEQLQKKSSAANGFPPIGLHILMGDTAMAKVKNMIQNISTGCIAPVEIIAKKL